MLYRLEPIMLKTLLILVITYTKIYTHFLSPKHHQCANDNITISECFNRMFDCSIRVHRSFANYVEGHSMNLEGSGSCQVPFGYTTVVSRVSNVSAIAVSYLMLVNSL